MILVEPKDGHCRTCGSQLAVVDANDATLSVECQSAACADCYDVETDAFGDGGIHYWPLAMAESGEEPWC